MEKRKDMRKAAGEVICLLRRKAGMSQAALAEKIGISYQQIQKYEYGRSALTLNRLNSLANEFQMKTSEFVKHIEFECEKD